MIVVLDDLEVADSFPFEVVVTIVQLDWLTWVKFLLKSCRQRIKQVQLQIDDDK